MAIKFLNTVAVDTDVLYADAANNRVGVGTTNPSQKLHINNSTASSASYAKFSNAQTGITTADGFDVGVNTGAEAVIWQRENSNLLFATNNSERMRINSVGNVGIGTTNPVNMLHVSGGLTRLDSGAASSNPLGVYSSFNTTAINLFASSNSGFVNVNSSGMNLGAPWNGSPKLSILNNGNVGIGTTAPEAKLEIKKGSSGLTSVNSQADALFLQSSSSTGITIATPDANKSSIFFSSASRQIGARINWSYDDLLMTLGTATANASLALKSGNESEAVRILSNGNVGIGTASPSELLHLESTEPLIRLDDTNSGLHYIFGQDGDGFKFTTNNSTYGKYTFDGNVGIGTTSPGANLDVRGSAVFRGSYLGATIAPTATGVDMYLYEGNNPKIYLQSAGPSAFLMDVGIGTGSPGARLHVLDTNVGVKSVYATAIIENTDAQLDLTSSSAGTWGSSLNFIEGNGATNTNVWSIARTTTGGGNNLRFNFGIANRHDNDTKMTISSGGNVGIGTTNPAFPLHVNTSNDVVGYFKSTDNKASIIIADNDTTGYVSAENDRVSIGYGNGASTANITILNGSYNVGIGTTSPNQKLHVIGNAKVSGVLYSSILSNDNGVSQKFRSSIGSDLMTILEGGNVGIGTTSPDSPLEIQFTEANGTAKQMLHLDYNPTNNYGSAVIKISGGSTSGASTEIEQVTGGGAGSFGTYMDTNVINRGLSSGAFGNINFVTGSSTSASSVVMTIGGGSQKGNVGIGTTSPGTINGVAFSSVGLHVNNGTLGRTITEGSQWGEYIMNHSGESANRRAKFIQSKAGDINIGSYNDNGTQRLHARLDNNGTFFLGNISTAYQTVFFDSTPGTVYGNGTLQISPLTSPGSGIAQFTTNFADRVGGGTTKHNVRVGGTVTATDFIGGSGAYLPLAGGTMTGQITATPGIEMGAGNINFADNGKVRLGSSSDLQIYHDGSNSYIDDTGTGHLVLNTNGASMKFLFGSEFMAQFEANGSVDLYHNNSKKFETTSTGVTVTGEGYSTGGWGFGTGETPVGRIFNNSGVFAVRAETGRQISFGNVTNGESVRINATGNVGIGTTSPDEKLEVSEGFILSSGASTNHGFELSRDTYDTYQIRHLDGGLTIFNSTDSRKEMTFAGDGNVGIGTDNPATWKLSVDSSNIYAASFDTSNNVGVVINGNNTTASQIIGFSNSNSTYNELHLRTNSTSTDGLYIDASGNVGIGTTSPLRKLHVVGNFAVNAGTGEYYGVNITGGESANPNILIGDWHNSSANIGWNSAGNYLRIDSQHGTNGAPIVFSGNDSAIEYMRITSAGDVGIGSTSPQARLDVQPTASNRKVTRIANDVMSTYFYNTQADAVLAWTCGSYYQAEVVITANQTNGGTYNNIYIRGIWSNNHHSHHWDELERVGSLSGSTFTMSAGQNGATENSGRLELDFDYINGSFSQLNVRVTDFYGTHSYTIT